MVEPILLMTKKQAGRRMKKIELREAMTRRHLYEAISFLMLGGAVGISTINILSAWPAWGWAFVYALMSLLCFVRLHYLQKRVNRALERLKHDDD